MDPPPRATPPRRPAAAGAAPPRSRIVPSPRVIATVTDGGVALLDLEAGRLLTLDDFGARAWAGVAAGPTLPELVERLRDDDDLAMALADDVVSLVAHWDAVGVIAWR